AVMAVEAAGNEFSLPKPTTSVSSQLARTHSAEAGPFFVGEALFLQVPILGVIHGRRSRHRPGTSAGEPVPSLKVTMRFALPPGKRSRRPCGHCISMRS